VASLQFSQSLDLIFVLINQGTKLLLKKTISAQEIHKIE
jgi:hypothetical protein